MNVSLYVASVIAAVALFGALSAAPAAAIDNIKPFGQQETLSEAFGGEIGYTVTALSPSADAVPSPIAGQLFEATVTANAVQGTVTPVIPFFNARAEDGANYRVLANVGLPQSLSGMPLPPGASSIGKLYFDVVGEVPNSVVYNDGSHDLLGWIAVDGGSGAVGPTGEGESGDGTASTDAGRSTEGVLGSTGPNFNSPDTTAGDQNGAGGGGGVDSAEGSGIEGGDDGGSGSSGGGGA